MKYSKEQREGCVLPEKGVLVIFHVYSCYADFFFATSSSHTCIIIPPTLAPPYWLASWAQCIILKEVGNFLVKIHV